MSKVSYCQFYDGTWEWENCSLVFRSDRKNPAPATTSVKTTSVCQMTSVHGEAVFRDTTSVHVQAQFLHKYRRRDLMNEPDVVTMQDVKDVVCFLSNNAYVNEMCLILFNNEKINPFLRTLILYIDLFLKVWNDLMERRLYRGEKLKHYTAVHRETRSKLALRELRCNLGKYYAEIILGEDKFKHFHHSKRSLIDDNTLFEMFKRYCTRFVWIALGRIQLIQIQNEMKRLFRSEASYLAGRRKFGCTLDTDDLNLIYGDESGIIPLKNESSYFFQRSAPLFDVLNYAKDYKDSSFQLVNKDTLFELDSVNYIKAATLIPEELFDMVGIELGIIGKPRIYYEPLLQSKEKEENHEERETPVRFSEDSRYTRFKKILFNTLDRLYYEVFLPEQVRVLGRNYGFVEAVGALDREHLRDAANSKKIWLQELRESNYFSDRKP